LQVNSLSYPIQEGVVRSGVLQCVLTVIIQHAQGGFILKVFYLFDVTPSHISRRYYKLGPTLPNSNPITVQRKQNRIRDSTFVTCSMLSRRAQDR